MVEHSETPGYQAPFETHPLYEAAMRHLASGDIDKAISRLKRLARLYPNDRALHDLLVRIELRATLASPEPDLPNRSQPTPILRQAVLLFLALTVTLVIIVGFVSAYARIVSPARTSQQKEAQINELHQDIQQRTEAGDWPGVREVSNEILTLVPGDPTAQAALDISDKQEELDRLYADAITAEQQGDWQQALDLLRQVEAENPNFRDVRQRIDRLSGQQALEEAWLEAQTQIEAGDLPAAIAILTQIRAQDPSFRRNQVEEQLFLAYSQLAQAQLDVAQGNLDAIRAAIGYLDKALELRPTDQTLVQERSWATAYLAGAEAFDREDWVAAVGHWQPLYTSHPDYQGGVLQEPLRQAYPRAGRQLIAEANGSLPKLRQALDYLDKALTTQPDNAELIEERRLVANYLAGADAYAAGNWSEAIAYWGPIFATRPDYQNGVLETNLRRACTMAPSPDASLCPQQ